MGNPARVYLSPPDMSSLDRDRLVAAFDSNWVAPLGPEVDTFEREFADCVGAPHAVALSSGTAALHLAMLVAGVQPGDRVITSTLTFVATANAIRHAGATPVFVDVDPLTWNLDPDLVERAVHDHTARGGRVSAVVPVDLFGQCADYDRLRSICQQSNAALIADAAESLGATYRGKPTGAQADFAAYSFNGNKIITTSGGGMLVTHSHEHADRVRRLASQARSPAAGYHHEEVGYNYRLSNLLAAIGRSQLNDLERRVERRRAIFRDYQTALAAMPAVRFMPEADYGRPTRWLTCIVVDENLAGCSSEDLRLALEAENIESRPVWKPMHLQPAHRSALVKHGRTPVAEQLWRQGLCLPSGSSLSASDQQRVIDVLTDRLPRTIVAPAA